MSISLHPPCHAAMLNALVTAIDGGSIKLMRGETILGELALASPCGRVDGSALVFGPIADGVAIESGKPDLLVICNSSGAPVVDCDAASFALDRAELTAGGPIKATAGELRF